ncbi:hypothetical protein ACJMK2_025689 [Sinanodonta woodiana]|uniref:Uncharacterized protein n=1 Tax=Sinanodonta woodiana TaxID=1069815 RepID=A0ABD3XH87_SINWO
MDAKRNIWIADVDETYERKFEIFSSRIIGEVELTILKTNSTTVRTTLKDNTQKGSALPENSYSTTERTPQKETTEKGDDCSDS